MANESERETVFDDLYRAKDDPWNVTSSTYEREKFAATLAMLPPERRFRSVLDIGCSFGTLTARFAQRSDHVTAIDVSGEAIAKARREHGGVAHFERNELPEGWPKGRYDLIVMSEVLYFLTEHEIGEVAELAARDLSSNGICLLVNWTGHTDLPVSGDQAATLFETCFTSRRPCDIETTRQRQYRIDLLKL